MTILPEIEEFKQKFESMESQLVWENVAVDTQTPVSVMLKLIPENEYHLLYESVEDGKKARYSIIALDPDVIWKCDNGKASINKNVVSDPDAFLPCDKKPFDSLRELLKISSLEMPNELPPMASGLFGYMGYDMVRMMEKIPDSNEDTIGVPDSIYMRPQIVIVFDSIQDQASIITTVWAGCEGEYEENYEIAKSRIRNIRNKISENTIEENTTADISIGPFNSHISEEEYNDVVRRARDYVFAGDVCQVVPSRRWEGNFSLPAFTLYRSLRSLNPSPYLFYLNMGGFSIVGSSPEILVRSENNKVTIRPLAGTRRRGETEGEDKSLEAELLADEKELAEHLMLLDLGRNDVGRVANGGTVQVTEKMVVERYSHVMHIVSNVEGELATDKDAIDALIAGFPAGTLTGAPKIRAMEIIDELEKEKRSFYGGTVGYFSSNGSMDTCIAIRTGLVKDGKLYIQAGGGVVADSKEREEFLETENKSRAIIKAAEHAEKFI